MSNTKSADGPVWLITGGNRGIGLECVRQLCKAGERVIATTRNPANSAALSDLAAAHEGLAIEPVDMNDRSSITALARRLEGQRIDILFNNAGLYGGSWADSSQRQSALSMDYALWEEIMRVNVMAPYQMVHELLPNLLLGQRRLIVNMSSDLGSITNNSTGQSYAYRSSKAALNMITKGLSVELAVQGVTVVSMAPGWTQTDLGGPEAEWTTEDSVANQLKVIAGLGAADNGRFVNLLGETVAW